MDRGCGLCGITDCCCSWKIFCCVVPTRQEKTHHKGQTQIHHTACWLFSIFWNIPVYVLVKYNEDLDFCLEDWPSGWYLNAYSLGWLIVVGILPLFIMTLLYSRVVFKLWVTSSQPVEQSQRAVIKSRKRVTKMVLTVTIVCAVCWLPNLIAYVLDFYGLNSQGDIVHTTTVVLVTLNSAVNPIIYCFQSRQFRRCVKVLLFSPCLVRRTETVGPA